MFTGLVEELGKLHSIQHHSATARLEIRASKVLEDMQVGDSIAVNGACQTVEECGLDRFAVTAFAQTLQKTNLGTLERGASLHLERSLRPTTRLGGHLVQGHVDGLGRLSELRTAGENRYLRVSLPHALLHLCILHGSICLDGVSLTIAKLHPDGVEINIIEHTWQQTAFAERRPGAAINVECDILGKYMLRFAERGLLAGRDSQNAEADKGLSQLLQDW